MDDGVFHKQQTEPTFTASLTSQPIPAYIGPYKIEALLNKGGMGWLYMGLHPETKRPMAVKVLPACRVENKEAIELFLKEAKAISLTDHPNIIKLYGEGSWEGGLYIAMEWVHGISLRQFLSQQSFSLRRSLEIILQVAFALRHLHSHGIIHRDLKPENILITEEGMIKVIDFGIAQLVKEPYEHRQSPILGTPSYMSPEQKENPDKITYASDIYSLGVLAYELILGKPSYGLVQTKLLPPTLGKIIEKALAVSIKNRYANIDTFIEDLSSYLESETIEREKPEQDATTELLEIFQKATYPLSPYPLPPCSFAQVGLAKRKSSLQLGVYYDLIPLTDGSFFFFLADPVRQELGALFSAFQLRGIVRALLAKHLPFTPLSFVEDVRRLMQQEPFFPPFAISYLHLCPLEEKAYFFNAGLSPLIHVPAGSDPLLILNENPLPLDKTPFDYADTSVDWKVGDILLYHSLTSPQESEPGNELISHLQLSIKEDLFLSAQSQAEALLRRSSPFLSKDKRTKVLFSIQRIE